MTEKKARNLAETMGNSFKALTGLNLQQAARRKEFQRAYRPVAELLGVTDPIKSARLWSQAKTKRGFINFLKTQPEPSPKEWEVLKKLAEMQGFLRRDLIKWAMKLSHLPVGRSPGRPPGVTVAILDHMERFTRQGMPREAAKDKTARMLGKSTRTVERVLAEQRRSEVSRGLTAPAQPATSAGKK